MNLHIITVYDSLNYGSYFQALALKWELEKYGVVDFVNVKHQNIRLATYKLCMKNCTKKEIRTAIFDYRKLREFIKAQKIMPVVEMKTVCSNNNDVFFFGSDEIWNVHRKKMRKTPEFFGANFPEKYRIALAPSVNRTQLDEIEQYEYIPRELEKFQAISVRDKHSKNIIEELTKRECDLIADPTLMHKKAIKEDSFIMLYTYGEMLKPEIIKMIVDFAKKNNLKLISVGAWFDFCDSCVPASPAEFLGYMKMAEYVITDTFHGLMFSLIYEKQFVVFPCGNIKVEKSLEYLEMQDQICLPGQELEQKLVKKIDYVYITPKIENYGEITRKFIFNTVMEIKKEIE